MLGVDYKFSFGLKNISQNLDQNLCQICIDAGIPIVRIYPNIGPWDTVPCGEKLIEIQNLVVFNEKAVEGIPLSGGICSGNNCQRLDFSSPTVSLRQQSGDIFPIGTHTAMKS